MVRDTSKGPIKRSLRSLTHTNKDAFYLVYPKLLFLVFINCSGFIKIDTAEMGEAGPDIYIEVLDGSRIHPEHYPWARKMAVDAMCNDDDDVSMT